MLPIPGTGRVNHLEENIGGAGIALSEKEYEEIGQHT
jgi:aryl-alcohol dehydrogenase-like predicted oxidoreductase